MMDIDIEITEPSKQIDYSNVHFVTTNENDEGPLNGYIEIAGNVDLVNTLGAIELSSENNE